MLNLKKILSRSLLALALGACGSAFAGRLYHVSIDTAKLGSGTAILDLELGALTSSVAPVTATLNHFNVGSAYGSSTFGGSGSGSINTKVTLLNDAGYSDLFQNITLGSVFSFDVSFDVGSGIDGSSFTAMLYTPGFTATLGGDLPLAQIDITPGQPDAISTVAAYASVGTVAAVNVPEPSTMLSMMSGLGLLGFGLRRRAR